MGPGSEIQCQLTSNIGASVARADRSAEPSRDERARADGGRGVGAGTDPISSFPTGCLDNLTSLRAYSSSIAALSVHERGDTWA